MGILRRLFKVTSPSGGREPTDPVDRWTPDELRHRYRELQEEHRQIQARHVELTDERARQQTALEDLRGRAEELFVEKAKLKKRLRRYEKLGLFARTPGASLERVPLGDDPEARKGLLRLLNRSGLHAWAPREVWGADADARFEVLAGPIIESGRTLLGRDRLYTLWQAVRNLRTVAQDVAEVGVYRGGSAAFLSRAFTEQGRAAPTLVAIDTFEGHPGGDIEAFETQKAGEFSNTSLADVREYLAAFPKIQVFKGGFAEVAPHLPEASYALVHIDVDLYRPTAACLEYFSARLGESGIIIVDDYMAPQCVGVTRAVQEFLSRHSDFQAWCLMTEQVVLVRTVS